MFTPLAKGTLIFQILLYGVFLISVIVLVGSDVAGGFYRANHLPLYQDDHLEVHVIGRVVQPRLVLSRTLDNSYYHGFPTKMAPICVEGLTRFHSPMYELVDRNGEVAPNLEMLGRGWDISPLTLLIILLGIKVARSLIQLGISFQSIPVDTPKNRAIIERGASLFDPLPDLPSRIVYDWVVYRIDPWMWLDRTVTHILLTLALTVMVGIHQVSTVAFQGLAAGANAAFIGLVDLHWRQCTDDRIYPSRYINIVLIVTSIAGFLYHGVVQVLMVAPSEAGHDIVKLLGEGTWQLVTKNPVAPMYYAYVGIAPLAVIFYYSLGSFWIRLGQKSPYPVVYMAYLSAIYMLADLFLVTVVGLVIINYHKSHLAMAAPC